MKQYIITGFRLTLVCAVFFSGFYTVLVWGIAQTTSSKGDVSITENGRTFYENVAQPFSSQQYFWPRPSAVDYNASGAGGSNKGRTNPEYLAQVEQRIADFLRQHPGITRAQIPSDMVTASGSGLDPHISVHGARVQLGRISAARGIPVPNLEELVLNHTGQPLWGMFGTARVNVLKLNMELDKLK